MAFEKGKSGNPSGRPKENQELKELARAHTAEAIDRLAFWMRSEDPRASVSAAQALLDRGHGKPMQAIEATGKDGEALLTPLDPMEVARSLAFILNQAALKGEG